MHTGSLPPDSRIRKGKVSSEEGHFLLRKEESFILSLTEGVLHSETSRWATMRLPRLPRHIRETRECVVRRAPHHYVDPNALPRAVNRALAAMRAITWAESSCE